MGDGQITVVRLRGALMVAVPSDPDDLTVARLQDQVLETLARHEAQALILDISAVDTVDSFFARTLSETARMVALMGGRTLIAGMRPSVAITTTQLGLSLGRVTTTLNTESALDLIARKPDRRTGT